MPPTQHPAECPAPATPDNCPFLRAFKHEFRAGMDEVRGEVRTTSANINRQLNELSSLVAAGNASGVEWRKGQDEAKSDHEARLRKVEVRLWQAIGAIPILGGLVAWIANSFHLSPVKP